MRILYLAHRVPFPPNKGDKIRSYHHVRHLARSHELHVLAFVDEPAEAYAGWELLQGECASFQIIPLAKKAALARGVWSWARGRSLSEGYYGAPAMHRAVARLTAMHRFDVAWAFSSPMAQYLPAGVPCRIADFADVDSDKWRQFSRDARGPLRFAYAHEAARLRAFEARAGAMVDRVLFVSAGEADLFRSFALPGTQIHVVPMGVDVTYFDGTAAPEATAHTPTLLFTGSLDYRPNVDAVRLCADAILPLVRAQVPDARFIAVGHRPAARARAAAKGSGGTVEVIGSVPDIRPYFRRADVYVAPLRLGRGVQNKILEAMAMRVPVVASPLAVAGLDLDIGHDVLVGETVEEIAAAVVELLRDPARRQDISNRALRAIRDRYLWDATLRLVDACLPNAHQLSAMTPAPGSPTVEYAGPSDHVSAGLAPITPSATERPA